MFSNILFTNTFETSVAGKEETHKLQKGVETAASLVKSGEFGEGKDNWVEFAMFDYSFNEPVGLEVPSCKWISMPLLLKEKYDHLRI